MRKSVSQEVEWAQRRKGDARRHRHDMDAPWRSVRPPPRVAHRGVRRALLLRVLSEARVPVSLQGSVRLVNVFAL